MNTELSAGIGPTHLTPAAAPRHRGLWRRTLAFGLALAATACASRPVLAAAPKPDPLTAQQHGKPDSVNVQYALCPGHAVQSPEPGFPRRLNAGRSICYHRYSVGFRRWIAWRRE